MTDMLAARAETISLIARYAPGERDVVELIWDEQSAASAVSGTPGDDQFLGSGLEFAEVALVSAVVVPVVVAALQQVAKRSVDAIMDALLARAKTERLEITDARMRQLAVEVARIVKSTS